VAGAVAGEFIWQNEAGPCGFDVMSRGAAQLKMLADRGRVA